MNEDFVDALNEIEREKGVSKEVIFEALESALKSSYRKNFGTSQNVEVEMNENTGKSKVYAVKEVVEEVEDDLLEISIKEALELNPNHVVGDVIKEEITPKDFGRIAAQTAKQVVIQRIKDAERDVIYDEFSSREGEIVTGTVQRVSRNNVFIDLGKTEGILPPSEQIADETYNQTDRVKLLILEVNKTTKGPQVILSRSHPDLIKRLFELEVPEIHDGIVEVFSISREAGSRTKIAVYSKDPDVDPLGACVGFQGSRVKSIVDELDGENIDIVIWSNDIAEFIGNSLSPSKVTKVEVNEENKEAIVVVPDYQLSLAIGKGGQNARLAAKLTNWKIDIKSESQYKELLEELNRDNVYDNPMDASIEDQEDFSSESGEEGEIENLNEDKNSDDLDTSDELDIEELEAELSDEEIAKLIELDINMDNLDLDELDDDFDIDFDLDDLDL